jgi:hypothetical protein
MPADNWSLKQFKGDDSPEVWLFRKNLSPEIPPRHPNYAFLAYLTFAYETRGASGLPVKEDAEILSRIEDPGFDEMLTDGLAVLIGVVTKAGIKDFLFYTRDPDEFLRRAEDFRRAHLPLGVGCVISPDPEWSQYDDLP